MPVPPAPPGIHDSPASHLAADTAFMLQHFFVISLHVFWRSEMPGHVDTLCSAPALSLNFSLLQNACPPKTSFRCVLPSVHVVPAGHVNQYQLFAHPLHHAGCVVDPSQACSEASWWQ